MSRLPIPTRPVRSRQEVTFATVYLPASGGTTTATQTISVVNTACTVVRMLGTHAGYYSSSVAKFYGAAGVELQDATTAKLTVKMASLAGGPYGMSFKAEVIEYAETPKSLQLVSGNDATSQTINLVDTAKCELVRGYEFLSFAAESFVPTLNTTSVSWNSAIPTAFRFYVLEWA